MSGINVTDAGPIEGTFRIDLSPGPGVYELRGERGTGKSTCIASIDWLAGHKVDVTLHDGAVAGSVEGFGVVAPIGGRKRRKGDFELDTIDAEKFSLTDILDPQGKTPEVRDATRIKALASLSEVAADPKRYYDLAGGQAKFDALGISPTDDPVVLATRIKAAYDKEARERENTAEAEAMHAVPLEHVPDGLDVSAESDLTKLGSARDAARDELQRRKSARTAGLAKESDVVEAAKSLEAIKASYRGPTIQEAMSAEGDAILARKTAAAALEKARDALRKAEADFDACDRTCESAARINEAAVSHAKAVEELTAIASQEITYPSESDIAKAASAVDKATADYDRGVRIRDVKQNLAKAKTHRDAENAARKASEEARNKAGQVFDILAKSLKMQHLMIQSVDGNPRLFVQHPKRGRTVFDQVNGLSDGERVDFTLRELLPHIEQFGMLPIPQRVWQDLQPSDRKNLHELAVKNNLYIFGAQVDDGELRVVYLGE